MERHSLCRIRGKGEWEDTDVGKCIDLVKRKLKEWPLSDSFYFLCEMRPTTNYWREKAAESEVE